VAKTAAECFRHPGVTARRKCYGCQKHLCPECQVNLDHHIFCGQDCHAEWKKREDERKKKRSQKKRRDTNVSLRRLSRDVRSIADQVKQIMARVESVESESSEITDLLKKLSEESSHHSWDRALGKGDLISRVRRSVDDIHEKLESLEASHRSLRKRLEKNGRPESGGSVAGLEELIERIRKLERSQEELYDSASREDESGLQERLDSIESRISEVLEAMAEGGKDSGGLSIAGINRALSKIKTIEDEQSDIREIIRKSHEDSTSFTLREIESIRKRLRSYEKAREREEAGSGEVLRPGKLQAVRGRTAAALATLFLISVAAGIWLTLFLRGGEPVRADAHLKDQSPNMVYDEANLVLTPPALDLASENLVLDGAKADITGYAPGASSVVLFVNNEEMGDVSTENLGFSFEGIHLRYGVNVIQVKALDGLGNEAYSMAWRVERLSQSMARVRTRAGINRMRGPRELPMLALTIDAGASDRRAMEILDILRNRGIITTFFLTGAFIERYPETVKRIVADGHEVGNHTYSHPHLTTFNLNRKHHIADGVNRRMLQDELTRTKRLFEDLTGAKMTGWWRAPYGEHNERIRRWAEEVGFKHVDWTRTPKNYDMLDWVADEDHRYYLDEEELYQRLTGIDNGVPGAANGGIILMHLGTERHKDFPDRVLPKAIDELSSRGYEFVTVSRMFSR